MTKKKAPGRDQKALVILGANLSTVEEQENELIKEISFSAHLCQEMVRFIRRGDPGRLELEQRPDLEAVVGEGLPRGRAGELDARRVLVRRPRVPAAAHP